MTELGIELVTSEPIGVESEQQPGTGRAGVRCPGGGGVHCDKALLDGHYLLVGPSAILPFPLPLCHSPIPLPPDPGKLDPVLILSGGHS